MRLSFSPASAVLSAVCVFTVLCIKSSGATFVVTNTLDSGSGSLRAAITANNGASGGTNTIQFNISGSTVHSIVPATALPTITRPVVLDGYSQPGSSSNTLANADNAVVLIEISGATLGTSANGLIIGSTSAGTTVRGLAVNGWSYGIVVQASNVAVEGCFIGCDPTGTIARPNSEGIRADFGVDTSGCRIGGTSPGVRNVISGNNSLGIDFQSGTNHVVQGNFIGVDVNGTTNLPNGGGMNVRTSNNLIGGTNSLARNIIAGDGEGIVISAVSGASSGNRIQGNYIGTDVTGTKVLNLHTGIRLSSSTLGTLVGGPASTRGLPPGNLIGVVITAISVEAGSVSNIIQGNLLGTDPTGSFTQGGQFYDISISGDFNVVSNNVIAGTGIDGVMLSSGSHGNMFEGNFIGTDITGTNLLGNAQRGIYFSGSYNNTVRSNIIAGNHGPGIQISELATNVTVSGNSIFANGSLGIDLGGNGITANDALDGDSGDNLLQNFPLITNVSMAVGNVTLSGTLNSRSNGNYRLEFFGNASCDPSGNGEGQAFLGFTNVLTDGSGNAPFQLTVANGGFATFTATATDTNGNTSEFSPCASTTGPCTLNCPANMIVATASNQCGAIVTYSPTTSGNCGGLTVSPPSGSFFSKGTNIVTCTAASGSNCTFTVTVIDTQRPTITCPADISTNIAVGQTNVIVNYAPPTVSDNCGVSSTNSSPPSGSFFPIGTTLVTCTATDTSGNTNVCSFTVTVAESNVPPVLTVQSNRTIGEMTTMVVTNTATDSNQPPQTLTYSLLSPPPGASINSGTGVITFTPGESFGPATATITTRVVDNGTPPLSATNSFTVTVLDTIGARLTVVNTNNIGAGSLRQAILTANTNGTVLPDFIEFAITNASHTIPLTSDLPLITQSVVIDGTTQLGAPAPAGTVLNPPVELDGLNSRANPAFLFSSVSNSVVRGIAISRFQAGGILFIGGGSNRVESCHIGTGISGNNNAANSGNGIEMADSHFNQIGGSTSGQGNVIGNNLIGVAFNAANSNVVQGNWIGISLLGAPLPNRDSGLDEVGDSKANLFGGTNAGAGNVIAFNATNGVRNVGGTGGTNNTIRGNRIFGNGSLGIDLGFANATGVTTNDSGDTDGIQNFPYITNVVVSGAQTLISGVLTSRVAVLTYAIDVYANTSCDASGFGEGEFYLGNTTLTTAANGTGAFSLTLPFILAGGLRVTATATSAAGSTSEFGPCVDTGIPALAITSISLPPPNHFSQLTGFGQSNVTYAIEAATNLNIPISWVAIGSNTANGAGLIQFTDSNAPFFPRRFYRLHLP